MEETELDAKEVPEEPEPSGSLCCAACAVYCGSGAAHLAQACCRGVLAGFRGCLGALCL